MKTLIIILSTLLIAPLAHAGIGVCRNGEQITDVSARANPANFTGENCVYYHVGGNISVEGYENLKTFIETTPRKHLVWRDGLAELTQAEQDALLAQEQADAEAQANAQHNAIIEALKAQVDNPTDPTAILNTCISAITTDEIRGLKAGTPKASKTDEQLKATVKACLDSFKK